MLVFDNATIGCPTAKNCGTCQCGGSLCVFAGHCLAMILRSSLDSAPAQHLLQRLPLDCLPVTQLLHRMRWLHKERRNVAQMVEEDSLNRFLQLWPVLGLALLGQWMWASMMEAAIYGQPPAIP